MNEAALPLLCRCGHPGTLHVLDVGRCSGKLSPINPGEEPRICECQVFRDWEEVNTLVNARWPYRNEQFAAGNSPGSVLSPPLFTGSWTDEPPTKPGYYWFRGRHASVQYREPIILFVGGEPGEMHASDSIVKQSDEISNCVGHWAGPILPPPVGNPTPDKPLDQLADFIRVPSPKWNDNLNPKK